MFLRLTDRTILIDRMCHNRPDIGISKCDSTLFDDAGIVEHADPVLPVLSAQHLHGRPNLIFIRRRNGYFFDFVRPQIDRLIRKRFPNGL